MALISSIWSNQHNRRKLVKGLFYSGLSALTFMTGQGPVVGLLVDLSKDVLGSMVSDATEGALSHWMGNWRTDRSDLNHDLIRAAQETLRETIEQLKQDWKNAGKESTHQANLFSEDELRQLEQILREDDFFSEYLAEQFEKQNNLTVFAGSDIQSIGLQLGKLLKESGFRPEIAQLLQEKLLPFWLERFYDYLKTEKGNRAWRAFQIHWQKALSASIAEIKAGNEVSNAALKEIQLRLDDWQRLLQEAPVNQRVPMGSKQINASLHAIRSELGILRAQTSEILSESQKISAQQQALYDKTKQIAQSAGTVRHRVGRIEQFSSITLGLILLLLFLGGGWFAWTRWFAPHEVMDGEFNIAIAEFSRDTAVELSANAGRTATGALANRVRESLSESGNAIDLIFQVWGPEQTGQVAGATPEQRAEQAAALANEINAHIVIYGLVSKEENEQVIQLEMYVSESLFSGLPEFIGKHTMGEPVPITGGPSDLATGVQTNRLLAARTQAIALISLGLAFYDQGDYPAAFDSFKNASAVKNWNETLGKESVYLMLGNTAGRLDRLEEAEEYFQQSLLLNPDYARARVGLAELYFRRALGLPPVQDVSQISRPDLELARKELQAALLAQDAPPSADILAKVWFGEGRLALIESQISQDPRFLDTAKTAFQKVIAAAESDNPRLGEHAALAHGYLGSIAWLQNDLAGAEGELRRAATEVHSARARASFWAQLGEIYLQLGESAQAVEAYRQAVEAAPDEQTRQVYRQKLEQVEP